MPVNTRFKVLFPIEWGDCDAAGIVFYPHFFRWFDAAFQRLLKSKGLSQATLQAAYHIMGTPLLDAGAQFHAPARFDEDLAISVRIVEWKRSTFRITYRGMVEERLIVSGHEIRAFVEKLDDGSLSSVIIPDAFKALFEE